MKKIALYLMMLIFSTINHAAVWNTLPENHPVNGGLTIIPLDMAQKPEVLFEGKKIIVLPSSLPKQWLLIVGIPLDAQAGVEKLSVLKPHAGVVPFHVSKKVYLSQYLTIVDTSKVDVSPEDEKRVAAETQTLNTLFSRYTEADPFAKPLIAPAQAPISSLFGLQRFYNQKPRTPHSGLDIAAAEGTPVHSITDGTVVSVADYFYTGNTVIVDHGMGVFSLYGHLKRTDVKVGQHITQGTVVGLVGKTGRATGPHLHWSMIMNQTLVDPLLFVPVRVITAVPPKKVQSLEKKTNA